MSSSRDVREAAPEPPTPPPRTASKRTRTSLESGHDPRLEWKAGTKRARIDTVPVPTFPADGQPGGSSCSQQSMDGSTPIYGRRSWMVDIDAQLRAARSDEERVTLLKLALKQQQTNTNSAERQAKQDCYLVQLLEVKRRENMELELEKSKHRYRLLEEHHKNHLREKEKSIKALGESLAKSKSEVVMYRSETEHLSHNIRTLEEDLDELRRIENEQKAKTQQKNLGLPPAYGDLDDVDEMAPHMRHKDAGILEVATLKKDVRELFKLALVDARAEAERQRRANKPDAEVNTIVFCMMSYALSDACNSLSNILDRASDIGALHYDGTKEEKKALMKLQAKKSFVADRVAKTIIEMCWRVISAHQLRPVDLRLSVRQTAELSLYYIEVDRTLQQAFQIAFETDELPSIWDMHTFIAQLTALHSVLRITAPGVYHDWFRNCQEYLAENVAIGRALAANRNISPAPGSEVSSIPGRHRAQTSDTSNTSDTDYNTSDDDTDSDDDARPASAARRVEIDLTQL